MEDGFDEEKLEAALNEAFWFGYKAGIDAFKKAMLDSIELADDVLSGKGDSHEVL